MEADRKSQLHEKAGCGAEQNGWHCKYELEVDEDDGEEEDNESSVDDDQISENEGEADDREDYLDYEDDGTAEDVGASSSGCLNSDGRVEHHQNFDAVSSAEDRMVVEYLECDKPQGTVDIGQNSFMFERDQVHGRTLEELLAMYEQEGHLEDDEDDKDWGPYGAFAVRTKWFCTNCTMPNLDDSPHCDMCGEHRESGILSQGYLAPPSVPAEWPSCSQMSGEGQEEYVNDVAASISYPTPAAIFTPISSISLSQSEKPTAVGFDERMLLHSEVKKNYFTPDTYANDHSALAARLAAGLCADLATSIMKGQAQNGFALVRPPGHHAGVTDAMGFCLHNNAAIAVSAAQAAGAKKVLIVDWDVHHGNGTQEIFERDQSVLYISLHRHEGGRFYPGSGAASEAFYVQGNIYRGISYAEQFAPDLTIISAGFDAAKGDPLGGCEVLLGENLQLIPNDIQPSKAGLETLLEVLKIQSHYWPILNESYHKLRAQWEALYPSIFSSSAPAG